VLNPTSITWSQLAKWQHSFGSKAAIVLPLVAFAFASLPDNVLENYLAGNWRIHVVFWGALLFLTGQLLIWWRRPIEFRRDTAVHQDVEEAERSASFAIFKSKVDLLERLIVRMEERKVIDQFRLSLYRTRLAEAHSATETTWKTRLAEVIISTRGLREYDNSLARGGSVVLLALGTAMMMLPGVINVVVTAASLAGQYFRCLRDGCS
jgi:hypothetical protein